MVRKEVTYVFAFALFLVLFAWLVMAAAGDGILIISPATGANITTSALFNVSFVNGTDIQDPQNASFYYNLSGTWTFIGNTTPSAGCTLSSCAVTLITSGLTDGIYGINATLFNSTGSISVLFVANTTNTITIDNTAPIVNQANITTLSHHSNYSGTNLVINSSLVDATIGIDKVIFNITNSSGGENITYNATREGTTSRYNFIFNTTSFADGEYNITVWANDSLDNLNNSGFVTVILDNTVPQVTAANITSLNAEVNYSGQILLNVSVIDLTAGMGYVFFNITNASDGKQNASLSGVREAGSSAFVVFTNSNNFPDGSYNITIFSNDSAGNSNNTAEILVRFDSTGPEITHSCSPTSVNTGETITCTCGATDVVSGVNVTTFTANPSTSSTGTYTTTCSSVDTAGNDATSEITYTVSLQGSGTSSSSGGGGAGETWTTYAVSENAFKSGHSRNLRANQRLRVVIEEDNHFIGVLRISGNSVVIRVTSDPQEETFNIGQTKKFEVTGDNFYDLSVRLDSIERDRAKVTINSIHEQVPVVEETLEEEEIDDEPILQQQPDEEVIEENEFNLVGIIIVILVVLVVIGVWFTIKRYRS